MLIWRKPSVCISPTRCFKVLRLFLYTVSARVVCPARKDEVGAEGDSKAGQGLVPHRQRSTVPQHPNRVSRAGPVKVTGLSQWLPHKSIVRGQVQGQARRSSQWVRLRINVVQGQAQAWTKGEALSLNAVPEQRWEASNKASYNSFHGIWSNLHSCAIPELVLIQVAKPLGWGGKRLQSMLMHSGRALVHIGTL